MNLQISQTVLIPFESQFSQTLKIMSEVRFIYEDFTSQQNLSPQPSSSQKTAEDEEYDVDITRKSDFYESADSVKIGQLRFRLIYHPLKRNYFVCFKKINSISGENNGIEDSHMSLPAVDIPAFRRVLRDMMGKTNNK